MPELREWMKSRGFSVKTLAAEMHCTPQHLSAVFNARRKMSRALSERLSDLIARVDDKTHTLSVNFTEPEWAVIRAALPSDIDLPMTLKATVERLAWAFAFNTGDISELRVPIKRHDVRD